MLSIKGKQKNRQRLLKAEREHGKPNDTKKKGEAIPHTNKYVLPLPNRGMMKKYAKRVLAAAMAVSMVMPMTGISAMAATTTSGETMVSYEVKESYTWSVPTKITFTSDLETVKAEAESGETQKVKVTENVIAAGHKLQITATGSGDAKAFTIKESENNNTLSYTIKVGDADTELTSGGVVLEVEAGTNAKSVPLTFTLEKKVSGQTSEKAGNYEGTVSYTSEVVVE